MRTNRLAVVVLGLALVALQAQGWAADKEKKPLKYAGKVYVQVRAAEAGAGIPGAKVQVLDDRVGKPELLSGVTDASGCCLVAAPVGYSSEEVDWERVGETSLAGLVVGLFGGLNKKDCIVRFNGVAVSITADGYKPFRGFVPYQDINGKAFEAVAQPVLLEKASSPAVSRIDSASRMTEFEWLQCPDELPAGAAVPVKFRFLYKHPAAPKLSARGTAATSIYACKWQQIFDDGKHDDAVAGDGIWGGTLQVPAAPKKGDSEVVLNAIIEVNAGERVVLSTVQTAPFTFPGQSKEAVEALLAARAARGGQKLTLCARAFELAPACTTFFREYLDVQFEQDRPDEVIAIAEKNPALLNDSIASAYYVAALYSKGAYARVVSHLAQAKLKPQDDWADRARQYYLGISSWKSGDEPTAITLLSKLGVQTGISELDAKLPPVKVEKFEVSGTTYTFYRCDTMFSALVLVGDLAGALIQAESASTASSPRAGLQWKTLATLYLARRQWDRALPCLQRMPPDDTLKMIDVFRAPAATTSEAQPAPGWRVKDLIAYCQDQSRLPEPLTSSGEQRSIEELRQAISTGPEKWRLHHDLALLLMKAGPHQDTGKELTLAAWHGKSLAATRDKMAGGDTRMMYGTRMVDVAPVWTSEKLTVYNGYADPAAQADFYISDICSSVPGFSFASGLPQLENSTEDQALQPVYAYVVGRALTDIGCARLAVPFMELALAQLPDSVEVHLAAAEMKLALGLQDEAAALQNKARSLAPDDPSIAERIASMAGSVQQN